MNIAATGNLYGYLPEIQQCDILLICGGILPLDINCDLYKSEFWLRSSFTSWVNNIKCPHVIITDNNCYLKEIKNCELLCKLTKGKLEVLNSNECVISVNDEVIKIWGIDNNEDINTKEEALKKGYDSMPKWCDIVISSNFPKVGKTAEGDLYLTKEIKEKSPKYCFSGKINSTGFKTYKGYGKTKFSNVAFDETHEIVYLNIF